MSKKKKSEAWGENGFESWGGYMAAKKAKLEEQFHSEARKELGETTNLFEGVAIFVNGYTDPTADELRRLMMTHGGVYHHYMRPRITTHVIASNLPYSKIVMYRKSQNPVPICKPQWITDSIKAGRLLNFQSYLLYSSCTDTQPRLKYKIQSKDALRNETKWCAEKRVEPIDEEVSDSSNEQIPETATVDEGISDPVKATASRNNARCTKDSEFLSEFYSHSRLHHIATMGATFKDYVNELRDKSNGKFPGLDRLNELKTVKHLMPQFDYDSSFADELLEPREEQRPEINLGRVIMHIDMDCFFVSVGIRNKPELKGVPVAVTHAKGNKPASSRQSTEEEELGSLSEVASCSYEARKAGVRNGMFLGEALKLCPNLKTIQYDFEGYKEVSYILYDTVASYTLDIEAVSCDEMYADCTKILETSSLTPMEFARIIRDEIKDKTGCPVSTGFGANKLLARLATKRAKPDGQFYIRKEEVESYVGNIDVRDLPGVGYTTAHKLNGMNIRTCMELQAKSLAALQKEFGKKMGEVLYNMCRGMDHSKLNLEHVRKSVSAEVNYGIRFESNQDAIDFLKKLSVEVCSRLKKANAKGRSITLKLMVRAKEAPRETTKFMGHGLCDYMTRSKNLISPIDDVDIITKEVVALWNQLQQTPEDMRGIGIQISRLQILKSKSRDATLAGFVCKSKQNPCTEETGFGPNMEPQPSKDSVPEKSKAKDLRTFFSNDKKQTEHTRTTDDPQPSTSAATRNAVPIMEENMQLPPDISQSVFSELPADIQVEILNYAKTSNTDKSKIPKPPDVLQEVDDRPKTLTTVTVPISENNTGKLVQTRQEDFFKHTKPGGGNSVKPEMPPIEEIDMSVLIQLPVDIRNEILNEYSANRIQKENTNQVNQTDSNGQTNAAGEPVNSETSRSGQDISFSQVDPEFLAALSDDLRRDVQIYCAHKKAESAPKMKSNSYEEATHSKKLKGGTGLIKQNKKSEKSAMPKGAKNTKKPSSKSNKKKGIQAAFRTVRGKTETENETNNKKSVKRLDEFASYKNKVQTPFNRTVTADEAEIILAHNRTIMDEENEPMNEHQEMLINLVNHLCTLPLNQVKMQIQTWINNSEVVNEVDFLSLATFLSMLPEKRRIEDLHVLLKTMHRCMTKTGKCVWHRTYRKAVKHVQHYMQIEYNSNLMVPQIVCDLQQCHTDVT